ncbi:hypothetical protein AB1Y20_017045 [Prymnesium parvum]|uniref:ubiquitinyl hydrolase 1 n=1 Tax=Prymnesium parvum TaxID=97485 RepID=A0AB34IAB1_PRYPA
MADDELQQALALSLQQAPSPSADEARQLAEAIARSLDPAPPSPPSASSADADLQAAIDLSLTAHTSLPPVLPAVPSAATLHQLLFGDASPLVEAQWLHQGICFAPPPAALPEGALPFAAALAQEHGGPCAVLASAQAFLLRRLLFDPDPHTPRQLPLPPPPSPPATPPPAHASLLPSAEAAADALLRGLADILWAAATTRDSGPPNDASTATIALLPPEAPPPDGGAAPLLAALLAHAVEAHSWRGVYDALGARVASLHAPVGALSFLTSALLSRGLGPFTAERDDASRPLIDPQFGHCSQEGLNLLLTGQERRPRHTLARRATSNVFDGERDLGGGLVLRGVASRPAVGLLSVLEALRYLQVGNFFKQPHAPIWVVASETHYSVLFGLSTSVQAIDPLSTIERQLEEVFSQYDQEGNGFISAEHLPTVMGALPQWHLPSVEELRPLLDPDGTSMLIWDRFLRELLPLHPEAAAALAAQQQAGAAADEPRSFELLHYNGLSGAGHAHKRALRAVAVRCGGARGQPVAGGSNESLAAVIQTRWKDASVSWEGPPPSIN